MEKYAINCDFTPIPAIRRLQVSDPSDPDQPLNQLYLEPRKITKAKYDHLQKLKVTIPNFFHTYYDQLPHMTEARKQSKNKSKVETSTEDNSKQKDKREVEEAETGRLQEKLLGK